MEYLTHSLFTFPARLLPDWGIFLGTGLANQRYVLCSWHRLFRLRTIVCTKIPKKMYYQNGRSSLSSPLRKSGAGMPNSLLGPEGAAAAAVAASPFSTFQAFTSV